MQHGRGGRAFEITVSPVSGSGCREMEPKGKGSQKVVRIRALGSEGISPLAAVHLPDCLEPAGHTELFLVQ